MVQPRGKTRGVAMRSGNVNSALGHKPRNLAQRAASRHGDPFPLKTQRTAETPYWRPKLCALRFSVTEVIDLNGEWIGHYPGHFDEVVRIVQDGDWVEAVKITGDDYVPAGAVTWRANLRTMMGEGQVSEKEFRNPRFVPGRLSVINSERIVFEWENCGEVEFRRDE